MNKRIAIFIGFIILGLAIWIQTTNVDVVRQLMIRLDDIGYDMQLRAKLFTHFVKPSSPVVIIDIDDKSLQAEGRWPWPRTKIAALIQRLQEEGVVVVATDIMFSESEKNPGETIIDLLNQRKLNTPIIDSAIKQIIPALDNDVTLATALGQQDSVLGMTFLPRAEISGLLPQPAYELTDPSQKHLPFIEAVGYISNIASLQTAAKYAGFINVYPDPDGIIRRVPLLIRYKNNLYPSLALGAVKLFLLEKINLVTANYNGFSQLESIKLGQHTIPTDSLSQILVPFRGKSYTFPYFSATDVLHKHIIANSLAGKIAFLGPSATGLGDLRATAVQGIFPGVEIQATIADGILTDNYFYKPEWVKGAEITSTIVVGIVFSILFPFFGPRTLTLISLVVPVLLILLNNYLWLKTGLIIYILVPILLIIGLAIMNIIYGYLFESRKRERLKEMFGQYVPEEHIDEMLKGADSFALLGEDREMTVLFADIRNFTTISETMTASELKNLLNEFFTPMTEIIFKFQGTIDKYIGDLIMAFWGAPLTDKKHAEHAIAAALEMQETVTKLKPVFDARGWPEINIGIGLNSGVMSVGDMGSQFRRNYTVLGDAVNLGSRVEGLTKFYGVQLMITEATRKDQKKFLFRELDRVRVKGKKNGVGIFEVICRKKDATPELEQEIQKSDLALNNYYNQQWDAAESLFNELHLAHPHVKMYNLYLKRIHELKANPPAANWDGVHEHSSK
jgi:adenylate cyclase